jgi:hypothetical protein
MKHPNPPPNGRPNGPMNNSMKRPPRKLIIWFCGIDL